MNSNRLFEFRVIAKKDPSWIEGLKPVGVELKFKYQKFKFYIIFYIQDVVDLSFSEHEHSTLLT
jgi:hypothetical protein